MKNMIKKLRNSAGMTLAETLMTVLILVMVAGVVGAGVPSAVIAYSKAVDAANAQVLISTTVNALRAELSTASQVRLSEGDVRYISSATESGTRIHKDTDGTILVDDFLGIGGAEATGSTRQLVSKKAVTDSLDVTYDSVAWAEGKENEVLVFNGLKVSKDETTVTTIDKLYIRVNLTKPDVPAGS